MKKCISLLLMFVFLFSFVEDAEAQTRKRRKSRKKQKEEEAAKLPFKEKLVFEIGIVNPIFFSNSNVSRFDIGMKPSVGYKLFDRLTAGVHAKFIYLFYKEFNTEFNLQDYGAGAFSRIKIIDQFYLKGELNYNSYDRPFVIAGALDTDRQSFLEPAVGMGYVSGVGEKWNYGIEALFPLSKEVRDFSQNVLDFWIKIDYNF